MAALPPASIAADDPRPIFDKAHLPGGPWRVYRARQTVDAVRVYGAWLVRRPSDGYLVEVSDAWLLIDQATGDPKIINPAAFSDAYELL